MLYHESPYAVLLLQEALCKPALKDELLIPVTLACLLSARLQFVFPMREEVSRLIDSIFDDYLRDLVVKSKGIYYVKNSSREEIAEIVDKSVLLVTTDQIMKRTASDNRLPCVFISQCVSKGGVVNLGFVDQLEDAELKRELACYTQLLNIHSSLLVSGSLCALPMSVKAAAD